VFERDKHTCQHCGITGVKMHAHHIKPYASHPELRLVVSNGLTLCEPCHHQTRTWGSNSAFHAKALGVVPEGEP
jgi:5-methylcytosine-specific restriction endonuclease McrA